MNFIEDRQILKSRKPSAKNIKISKIFLGSDTAAQIYRELIGCIKKKIKSIDIDLTESEIITRGGIEVLKLCQLKAARSGIDLRLNLGNIR